jgi:hypothetical protein
MGDDAIWRSKMVVSENGDKWGVGKSGNGGRGRKLGTELKL